MIARKPPPCHRHQERNIVSKARLSGHGNGRTWLVPSGLGTGLGIQISTGSIRVEDDAGPGFNRIVCRFLLESSDRLGGLDPWRKGLEA